MGKYDLKAGEFLYSVSIVIPVTDEEASLKSNVEQAVSLCGSGDIEEIIFVLWDKTTERCFEIIDSLINEFPQVKFVKYTQKSPKIKGALYESLNIAKGTHTAHFTGDPDTSPEALARMIEASKRNPDAVVIASRWIDGGGFEGYGRFNKFCNFAFQQMLRILYGADVHDYTYSFRIFPTESMKKITWEEEDFPVVLENTLKLKRLGYRFIEVPAVWRADKNVTSRNSFSLRASYLPVVFRVRFTGKNKLLK